MAEFKTSKKNGANRCPHCGATDVKLDPSSGLLKCSFCRSKFKGKATNAHGGVDQLKGEIVGEGAGDIIPDEKIIVTLKCPACGAEVVINTDEAVSARCHWCRHTLSLNEKMKNGAVPDMVLPFKIEKSVAEEKIREFVEKRRFFAHPKFRREFMPENVMGVYLPYMIVDVNAHAEMTGEAEHLIRSYTVGTGNNKRRYYDAEAFSVTRDFDLLIDDLTIEASSEKLQQDVHENTNNIINAIMPFDTENCEDWNPNYLHGYASERRDTNTKDLRPQLDLQVGDVARYKVRETMDYYNRGAKWTSEKVDTVGIKWKSAYLPVWLYSYLQDDSHGKMLHYVAVNARTSETMGSVPINKARLLAISILLEVIGIICGLIWFRFFLFGDLLDTDDDDGNIGYAGLLFFTPGFIFYWLKMARYRNMNARHKHEADTVSEIRNLNKTDKSIGRRNRLSNSRIEGENDTVVKGVVAKSGSKYMGEKMANYLGIGRMVGSKVESTPVGQETVKQAHNNKHIVGVVVGLIVMFAIMTAVAIGLASHWADSDRDENDKLTFQIGNGFFTDIKNYGEVTESPTTEMVTSINYYDETAGELKTLSLLRKSAESKIRYSKFSDTKLNNSIYLTEHGKNLAKILNEYNVSEVYRESDSLDERKYTYYFSGETESKKYAIFCEMREEEKGTKYANYYTLLECVKMDKTKLK